MRYLTLLRILDEICREAPSAYKSYKASPSDYDKLCKARSKAFIHLYLKAKCGITNFNSRHVLITDGPLDGGLDAYYIDTDRKKLHLIQSKFRMTEKNFEEKSITADELVRMDIKRILNGDETDSNGHKFNKKVKRFQKGWSKIRDPANYQYLVLILGNLKRYSDSQMRRLVENSKYEVFDFKRSYNELVFPLCAGNYYDPEEIDITIDLFGKEVPLLKQTIDTKYGKYDIRMLFVPAQEIGRITSMYKNSLLQYNPRNFLDLSKNEVNKKIKESVIANIKNDFAILNNGITMISDSFFFTEATGRKNVGQVIIKKPAIINGGQTAYVLSNIFEKYKDHKKLFGSKEVLLKVIIIKDHNLVSNKAFIEEISDATNQQTRVSEADRRANDNIQLNLQNLIYNNFGYFYERKKGEFHNGVQSSYIKKDFIIKRNKFIKSYLALQGKPSEARSSSEDKLFESNRFKEILSDHRKFRRMLFSYLVLKHISKFRKKSESQKWGQGLRYGKMAIIAAIGVIGFDDCKNIEKIKKEIENKTRTLRKKWKNFEKWARAKKHNSEYLSDEGFDFDNYYKGSTVDRDIKKYFKTSN